MGKLTFSLADFLVRTSVQPGAVQAYREAVAAFGFNTIASSTKSARVTRSLKTSAPFDVEDWEKSCGPSLRSGTMRNGIVYPQPPLVPLTVGTASGSWPTPTAHNAKEGAYPAEYTRNTPTLAARVGGRLNPRWIEWLMGFPDKHTDLNS